MKKLLSRIHYKYQRTLADRFYRNRLAIKSPNPIISFSFDDAPFTAFSNGGSILKAYGLKATFFISLGLLGSGSPSGTIASGDDLLRAVKDGHELGCHTFDHKDPWLTITNVFIESILKNRQALDKILPSAKFTSFAYPLSEPKPITKHQVGKFFNCCRGGGQTFNQNISDLNLLKAFFIDRRNNNSIESIKRLIDQNAKCCGWLIFATHDIADEPSPYGCSIGFFNKVVKYAVESGSSILPIDKAYNKIQLFAEPKKLNHLHKNFMLF